MEKGQASWRGVVVRQDPHMVDGLGGVVWNAAYKLCEHLEAHPELVRGKRVLELGAGCGLPGLVVATLGASAVVVTDQETDLLRENVRANARVCQAPLSVAELAWGDSLEAVTQLERICLPPHGGPFDVVIGTEITTGFRGA